jgi:NAD(P)-dependent dehydrogenase (short-subunit alcohol dehydrogenase family)
MEHNPEPHPSTEYRCARCGAGSTRASQPQGRAHRSGRADPAPSPGDPGVTIGYPYRRLAEVMLPLGASPSSFGQSQTSDGGEAVGANPKTALVTGAASASGEATACAYAAAGVNAVTTGRDVQRGEQPVRSLSRDGRQARFVRADLEEIEDLERHAADVGDIGVPVNNTGVFPLGRTHEVADEFFDSAFALDVKAPFFPTAAPAPKMPADGGGAIVDITTMVANFGMPGMSLSPKAALILLTRAWAAECGPEGVRVMALASGPTRTPGTEPMGDELDELAAKLPLRRPATPDEIAAAALFHGRDGASSLNGSVRAADGGRTVI